MVTENAFVSTESAFVFQSKGGEPLHFRPSLVFTAW